MSVEEYLPTDITGHEFDDIPMAESQPILDVSYEAKGMRLDVDPAAIFRGVY